MRYQQPYGISDANGGYINGDPSIGRQGSIPPAAAFEQPMREIVSVIANSDFVPSDGDLAQLMKSVRRQWLNFTQDHGLVNSIVCTLVPPLEAYHAGIPLRVLIAVTNTGNTTMNVDGLGPKPCVRSDGAQLQAGDIVAGMIANMVDNGASWQLQNPLHGVAATSNSYTTDIPYCADIGTVANQIIAPFSPALIVVWPGGIVEGKFIAVKVKNTITGPVTITCNALAPLPIYRDDGTPMQAGDILANEAILLEHHGTYYQFMGLVRSQVLTPPAPALRGLIATETGYGPIYIPSTQNMQLYFYNVSRNTLQTSTFNGNALTVGAGEGGVWACYASAHLGFIGLDCNYAQISLNVNGGEEAIGTVGYLVANTGSVPSCGAHLYVNSGSYIQSMLYQQSGTANYVAANNRTRFTAYLVSK